MVMIRLITMLLTTSITLTCPMAHTISMGMVQRYCPEYRKTVRAVSYTHLRCDRAHYTGEYKDKDWMQHLQPEEIFQGGYTIEIDE